MNFVILSKLKFSTNWNMFIVYTYIPAPKRISVRKPSDTTDIVSDVFPVHNCQRMIQ